MNNQQVSWLEFTEQRHLAPCTLVPKGAVYFSSAASAAGFPLARDIFATPGVVAVYLMRNSVNVIGTGETDWSRVAEIVQEELHSPALAQTA